MAPQIGSVLLASTNPTALRDWYVEAFAPQVDKTPDGAYDVLNFDGFYVMIDSRDDIGERNPEPGRLIVNVEVDDARGVAAKLDGMNGTWLAEL
ncbi:MAG: VOC family protein, partial [Micromonosporaceae bacterium]|nr:VOC family protein [Micromonosporaceae bacterium]